MATDARVVDNHFSLFYESFFKLVDMRSVETCFLRGLQYANTVSLTQV